MYIKLLWAKILRASMMIFKKGHGRTIVAILRWMLYFFFFFNNFWSSLCFINWWQLFFPVVCELWFPDYREKTRLKPVKLGAPTVSDVNTKSPYPHYYYLSFWTFVHSKIFFLLLGEKLRREESFFLFFWVGVVVGCGF